MDNRKTDTTIYFHNLEFDLDFILNHFLFDMDKEYGVDFTTLVSGMGQVYTMRYKNKNNREIELLDSYKIWPSSVAAIARSLGMEVPDENFDYNKIRELDHIPTEEELHYLKQDTLIPAVALRHIIKEGDTRMTVGSNALAAFKKTINKGKQERYRRFLFPVLEREEDDFIRQAFRGGFVYLSDIFRAGQMHYKSTSYDVNSLYPAMMVNKPMPFGRGVYFEGDDFNDPEYPLAIMKIEVDYTVKPNHIPTIQAKNHPYLPSIDYMKDTDGIVELYLTNIDLELLMDHHDIGYLNIVGGYKYKAMTGIFDEFILKEYEIKETTKGARREISKLRLNNIYGKFGTNPKQTNKIPTKGENGQVKYIEVEAEDRDPEYTPVAIFTTSYGRDTTIRAAQANFDRFIYADTDSIHLAGHEEPVGILIHPSRIGEWDHEGNFGNSKYLRAKTYARTIGQELEITCAGLPATVQNKIKDINDFYIGAEYNGKLMSRRVKGGIVLYETTFRIIPLK